MAQLVISPANPAIEQGQSVDITVTVDGHIDRLIFRDAGGKGVTFTPSLVESVSDWDIDVDSPLTSELLESSTQHAVFRVTWPA